MKFTYCNRTGICHNLYNNESFIIYLFMYKYIVKSKMLQIGEGAIGEDD